jgi:hypothetical protein
MILSILMDDTVEHIEANTVKISPPLPITENATDIYIQFLDRERETLTGYRGKVDRTIPNFRETREYKDYRKKLDYNASLEWGGKALSLAQSNTEDNPKSFMHVARNLEDEPVGFDIVNIKKSPTGALYVYGEFLGVSSDNKQVDLALKLLEARHTALKNLGIYEYEASMLPRTAKVLEHRGINITLISEPRNDNEVREVGGHSYKITLNQ